MALYFGVTYNGVNLVSVRQEHKWEFAREVWVVCEAGYPISCMDSFMLEFLVIGAYQKVRYYMSGNPVDSGKDVK